MSKRERVLALIIVSIVGLVLLDWLVVGPAWNWFKGQGEQTLAVQDQLARAQMYLDHAEVIRSRWDGLAASGLGLNEGALRIAVQQNLSVWSQEAGFNLSTLVSGRTITGGEIFDEMQFIASGSGPLASTVNLLERIYASALPLRLLDLDITSRSENTDLLAVRATFSTVRLRTPTRETREGGDS